jgi:hypothetical protein
MFHDDRREWRRWAQNVSPVFIVGEPRSGTSILFRSLQAHPSFTPSVGTHLAESHAADLLLDVFEPADVTAESPLAEYAHGVEPVLAAAKDFAPLRRRRRLVRSVVGQARLVHRSLWVAAGEHHVIRRYLLETQRQRGEQRPLDKSALNLRWVPHLGTAFPRARFLYIVRHPIDVYTSYARRVLEDPEGSAWADIDETTFCDAWNRRVSFALAHAAKDARLLIVRYEEFTHETESVMRRVLDHVGEPFDRRCLLPDDDDANEFTIDPHLFGEIVTTTKTWQDYVDADSAHRIQERLAGAMSQLGYAPHV